MCVRFGLVMGWPQNFMSKFSAKKLKKIFPAAPLWRTICSISGQNLAISCGLGAGGGVDVVDGETAAAAYELRAVTNPFGVKSFEAVWGDYINEPPVGHFEKA